MARRVALVTGAARGIGRAIAADLGRDHDLAFTYNASDPALLLTERPDALAIRADLSADGFAEAVVDAVLDRFGRLDVLVNNAGHVASDDAESFAPEATAKTMAVNLAAPMALVAAALPHLEPGSAVVNISSMNARLPAMSAHSYSASKAALDTWTRIAAKSLGPRGIRVNAVAPGPVNTPEAPRPDDLTALFLKDSALGHLATPADIAAAVRFLTSDAAAAITGEILTVSAGYRL